ncbi:MAG TPA: glycosyltransferase family 2 protein, partial [Acidimicrobiales bacterium]|nr:glycosyltransferase family 2 protein [Acidimicrobiales bacterium]
SEVVKVSAVVVSYNSATYLPDCLRSLRSEGLADIVVVDNASSDGSVDVVRAADPEARVVETGANLGFGSAANRGVATTLSEYVLILNPDTVVEPGTVKALSEAFDRDPGLAVVGPRMENLDGTLYPSVRRFPDLGVALGHAFLGLVWPANPCTRRYRMLDWDHDHPAADVDWVGGACVLVRRAAFDVVGGFDEAYFMYVEDVDLCWRLQRAGWRVAYEPGARVVHTVGASSERAPYRMIAAHHRSLLRFAVRSTTGPRRALLPLVAAGLGVRTLLAWVHRAWRGVPHAVVGGAERRRPRGGPGGRVR